jgi:hypothetical protein
MATVMVMVHAVNAKSMSMVEKTWADDGRTMPRNFRSMTLSHFVLEFEWVLEFEFDLNSNLKKRPVSSN